MNPADFMTNHWPGCPHVQNMGRPRSMQLIGPTCDCDERDRRLKDWELWLDSDEGKVAVKQVRESLLPKEGNDDGDTNI